MSKLHQLYRHYDKDGSSEIYVYLRGQLVYKRWIKPSGEKSASILFNDVWPNVWLPSH